MRPLSFYRIIAILSGLALFVLLAAPTGPLERKTKHVEKTAAGGRPVRLKAESAELTVRAGTGTEVKVTADLAFASRDKKWMAAIDQRFDVAIRETAAGLEIEPTGPVQDDSWDGAHFFRFEVSRSYDLQLVLEVPKGTRLDLDNRYGDVSVTGVEGALEVALTSGNLTATNVRGGAEIDNRYGDVELSDLEGDLVLEAGSGSVEIAGLTGGARLRNQYGNLVLSRVTGPVDIAVTSGEVEVREAGGAVSVQDTYGAVTIEGAAGDVTVSTQSSPIRLERIGGRVNIDGEYGSVEVAEVAGAVDVVSGSGTVKVAGAAREVSIRNRYAGVSVDGAGGAVTISNESGEVAVAGLSGAALTARHRVETRYGSIDFEWPAAAPAPAFTLECTYGDLESDFPGRLIEGDATDVLSAPASDPSSTAALELSAVSGSVRLKKARP